MQLIGKVFDIRLLIISLMRTESLQIIRLVEVPLQLLKLLLAVLAEFIA